MLKEKNSLVRSMIYLKKLALLQCLMTHVRYIERYFHKSFSKLLHKYISFFKLFPDFFSLIVEKLNQIRDHVVCVAARLVFMF